MEDNALVMVISSYDGEEEENPKCLEKKEGLEEKVVVVDWIKQFLDLSDEEEEQGNEVVVDSEVKKDDEGEAESLSKCSSISIKPLKEEDEEDEDDCVVLDGDPEKNVNSVEKAQAESDEMLVVGEKGQIACRDFPHARHLCSNFPFSSTPHQRHCDKCHCYVCDSLAPCLMWGTGLSTADHCHATDKSQMWKTLRKNLKLAMTAPSLPASTNHVITTHNVRNPPQFNNFLPLNNMHLSANSMLLNQPVSSTSVPPIWSTITSPSLIPQNQAFRPPTTMHTWSSPNSSLLNHVLRPISTIPVPSTVTNLSHSFPRQLLGVRNHAIEKQRVRHGAISVGPQFVGSHMMSNNVCYVGSTLGVNHSTQVSPGFSNNVNASRQGHRYQPTTGFSSNRTHGNDDVLGNRADTQAPRQSNHGQNFNGSYIQRSGAASSYVAQLNRNQHLDKQHHIGSQNEINVQGSRISDNGAPPSYVAHINRNQHLNKQQHIGTRNENAQGNVIRCGITMQNGYQQKPHDVSQSESTRKPVFSAFDSNWAEINSQSISHKQSSRSMNQPSNVKASGTQFSGNTNLSLVDDIKNWLFDDQDFLPVVADAAALASDVKIPSPALSKTDTRMF
ncbi:hypothetical protein RIF29_40132 [Crotalaria pallida]|uniref:Uncharacterized protein n=1 Tax=Crotalaria pallida TaxID=3830 RepID=A0AAN9E2K4_CROPI